MMELKNANFIKAEESLDGAESEFANGRYNNCANRCYYACYQVAIAALFHAGVPARQQQRTWSHSFVQAEFNGRLINREKVYPERLRTTLFRTVELRNHADYTTNQVREVRASRAVQRSREFVGAIRQEVNGNGR